MTDSVSTDYSRGDPVKVEYSKGSSESDVSTSATGGGKKDSVIDIHNLHRQLIESNAVSADNRIADVDQARAMLDKVKQDVSEARDSKMMMEQTFSIKRENLIELLK